MKIKLLPEQGSAVYWSDKNLPSIGNIDADKIQVCNLIKIYDDYYDVCMISKTDCFVRLHKGTVYENTEDINELDTAYESKMICPFCSATIEDCGDYSGFGEDVECPVCGATFELTKEYTVEYTTKLVRPGIVEHVK